MPGISAKIFVDALGDWIAVGVTLSRIGLAGVQVGTKAALHTHEVDEAAALDTYTLLRMYPGSPPPPTAGINEIAIQCLTRGQTAAALLQAEKVFDYLRDADGLPKRNVAITGYVIQGLRLRQTPGQIARDDRGRADVVFNFDAAFYQTGQ